MALSSLSGRAMGIIGTVVGIVVVLSILGATFGTMATSVADINNDLSTADLNDTTANTVAGVFPLLVGVAFVIGIVGVILAAVKFRGSR